MDHTYYLINGERFFCYKVYKDRLIFERLDEHINMIWKTLTRKQFNTGLLDGTIEED